MIFLDLEAKVFRMYGKLTNIKRDGDGLLIDFGSDEQHKFQPVPRPGPAANNQVGWIRRME